MTPKELERDIKVSDSMVSYAGFSVKRIYNLPRLEAFYLSNHDAPSRIEALEAKLDRARQALANVQSETAMSMNVSAQNAYRISRAALSNIEDKTK